MATTYYVGNIEVTSEGGRRARDPSQQKALDRYWRRRDGRPKKEKKSKVPTNKVEAAQTAVKALGFFQKFKTVGIILLILLIIILVVFVYLSNVYVDPNYLNVNAYMNKTYSRDTTFKVIMDEKNFIELRDDLTDYKNSLTSNVDNAVPAIPADRNGLSTTRFSQDFVDINNYLLSYCSTYGSLTVNIGATPVTMDGLFYMAMCNTESGGWCVDYSKTLSSVYPSAFVDINVSDYKSQINSVDITQVLLSPDAYKPSNMGYTWSYKPWVSDPLTQGPSTQWFAQTSSVKSTNELSKITGDSSTHIKNAMYLSGLYTQEEAEAFYTMITKQCTGSGLDTTGQAGKTQGKIGDYGDRWCIKDQCEVFAKSQEGSFNTLSKTYPSNYTATPYEVIMLARMNHWLPSVCTSTYDTYINFRDSQTEFWYEHWNHYQSWIAYAKVLSSEPVVAEVRRQVLQNVNEGKYLVDYCDMNAIINVAKEQMFTYDNGHDEPFIFSIDEECKSQQAKTEFIKYLYNYVLLETLYSEGGTSE